MFILVSSSHMSACALGDQLALVVTDRQRHYEMGRIREDDEDAENKHLQKSRSVPAHSLSESN